MPNKKDLVTSSLTRKNIAVCALQETEIGKNFPEGILNCGNFNLELEDANVKKRVGFYRNDITQKKDRSWEKGSSCSHYWCNL